MDTYIKRWIEAEAELEKAEHKVHKTLTDAEVKSNQPKKLRPATPADMVAGNIIWYKQDKYNPTGYWKMINYVSYPNDPDKAYTAHDGCRYGLEGAFVED